VQAATTATAARLVRPISPTPIERRPDLMVSEA
jgi:hypothetical protein